MSEEWKFTNNLDQSSTLNDLRLVFTRNGVEREISRTLPCSCQIEWMPQGSRIYMCREHEIVWLNERGVQR